MVYSDPVSDVQSQAEDLQQQLQSVSGTPGSSQPDYAQLQQQQLQDAQGHCTQLQQQLLESQALPARLRQQLQQAQALLSQLQQQLLEAQQQSSQLQEQLRDAQGQLQQQLHPEVMEHQQSVGGGGGTGSDSSRSGESNFAVAQMQVESLHSQLSASKGTVQELTSEILQLKTQTQAYEIELAERRLKCSKVESELSDMCASLSATAAGLATSKEAGFQQQGLLTALQSQLAALQQQLQQQRSLKPREEGQSAAQHWAEEEDADGCSDTDEAGWRDAGAVGAIVDKLWNDLQQERVNMLLTPSPTPHPPAPPPPPPTPPPPAPLGLKDCLTSPYLLPGLHNRYCFAI